MVNRMVQRSEQSELDRVFAALADGTRRGVLARLGSGPATIGELAEPAGMTLTGMTKHVRVLEQSGLVVTEKVGRTRRCRLGEERLEDAMAWIGFYQRLWERRLDGLEAFFTLRAHESGTGTSTTTTSTTDSGTATDDDGGDPR
jgi:DNA-binding transcriptional ArsR family regulator